jgi:hypothetical protein
VSQRGKALPEGCEVSAAQRNQFRQRLRLGKDAIQFVGIDQGVSHLSNLELASDFPCDCALANTSSTTYHEDIHEGEDTTSNVWRTIDPKNRQRRSTSVEQHMGIR